MPTVKENVAFCKNVIAEYFTNKGWEITTLIPSTYDIAFRKGHGNLFVQLIAFGSTYKSGNLEMRKKAGLLAVDSTASFNDGQNNEYALVFFGDENTLHGSWIFDKIVEMTGITKYIIHPDGKVTKKKH